MSAARPAIHAQMLGRAKQHGFASPINVTPRKTLNADGGADSRRANDLRSGGQAAEASMAAEADAACQELVLAGQRRG
jgi:hypothetical protein